MEQGLKDKLKEALKSGQYDARLRRDFSEILTSDNASLLEREISYQLVGAREGLTPGGLVSNIGQIYTGITTY